MIAPAYTMICTANRNGASSSRYITAIVKKFTTRNSAACTALRTTIMPIPVATESGAKTQKTTLSSGTPVSLPGRRDRCRAEAAARATAPS